MAKTRLTPKFIAKEIAVMAAIVLAVYFGNQQVQIWLGQRALENTNYEHISFSSALEKASSENKLVLVDFAAIWCGACRKMDNAIFSDKNIQEIIDSKYVFTRLEYESNDQEIFRRYGIERFPTLMVMDASGEVIRRLPVTFDSAEFAKQL